jgi:hypothetical protein
MLRAGKINIPHMSMMAFGVFTVAAFLYSGCSAIIIPNPEEVIKHPLGTESIKVGMTKDRVESLWGKPDQVKMVENKDKWQGATREVWIYRAQYGNIPVDAGYLSSTKKLYFDGNNLTEISE